MSSEDKRELLGGGTDVIPGELKYGIHGKLYDPDRLVRWIEQHTAKVIDEILGRESKKGKIYHTLFEKGRLYEIDQLEGFFNRKRYFDPELSAYIAGRAISTCRGAVRDGRYKNPETD